MTELLSSLPATWLSQSRHPGNWTLATGLRGSTAKPGRSSGSLHTKAPLTRNPEPSHRHQKLRAMPKGRRSPLRTALQGSVLQPPGDPTPAPRTGLHPGGARGRSVLLSAFPADHSSVPNVPCGGSQTQGPARAIPHPPAWAECAGPTTGVTDAGSIVTQVRPTARDNRHWEDSLLVTAPRGGAAPGPAGARTGWAGAGAGSLTGQQQPWRRVQRKGQARRGAQAQGCPGRVPAALGHRAHAARSSPG